MADFEVVTEIKPSSIPQCDEVENDNKKNKSINRFMGWVFVYDNPEVEWFIWLSCKVNP